MASQTLKVEGMTCEGCAQTVKNAVNKLVGMRRVEVDLENKTVSVEFDKAQKKIESIKDIIIAAGFEARY